MTILRKNILKRCIFSAIFTFGGLHLTLIVTVYFTAYGILSFCLSPLVGLAHGVLAALLAGVFVKFPRLWASLFYSLMTLAGIIAYAAGAVAILTCFPELPFTTPGTTFQQRLETPFVGDVALFWALLGGVAGIRLGFHLQHNIRQCGCTKIEF